MTKLSKLLLNGSPRVAVAFTDSASPQLIQDIEAFGLDVVELRVDQYSSFETSYVLQQVRRFSNFPSIATIRTEREGGGWNLSDEKRLQLFNDILPYVDCIDIELSSKAILKDVISSAHAANKLVLISYHDFDKMPTIEKLEHIIKEAKICGADIVKMAGLALSREDVQTLAQFTLAHANENIITIAMGAEGTISRVLFPILGSLLTYAYIGTPTAPGQLDYQHTIDILRLLYPKYNQEKVQVLKLLELS